MRLQLLVTRLPPHMGPWVPADEPNAKPILQGLSSNVYQASWQQPTPMPRSDCPGQTRTHVTCSCLDQPATLRVPCTAPAAHILPASNPWRSPHHHTPQPHSTGDPPPCSWSPQESTLLLQHCPGEAGDDAGDVGMLAPAVMRACADSPRVSVLMVQAALEPRTPGPPASCHRACSTPIILLAARLWRRVLRGLEPARNPPLHRMGNMLAQRPFCSSPAHSRLTNTAPARAWLLLCFLTRRSAPWPQQHVS
jgi:hypothetical protein